MSRRRANKANFLARLDLPAGRKAKVGTPEKLQCFLDNYAATGQVVNSCEAAGLTFTQHYRWLAQDARYKAAFEEVQHNAGQRLEDVAMRLALAGEIPVLLPMLRRFKPEYRERLEQNVNINVEVTDRLEAARARARARTEVIEISGDSDNESPD